MLLQIRDLPDSSPTSKLAYWQSVALSRDLTAAQVGSQSQLNSRQLVSRPSLLAAALVTDPAMVLVPLHQPPRRSDVSDWLSQLGGGVPNDAKIRSQSRKRNEVVATSSVVVSCGEPIESKCASTACGNEQSENAEASVISGSLKRDAESSGVDLLGNDDDGGCQEKKDCKMRRKHHRLSGDDRVLGHHELRPSVDPVLRRRSCRVSFVVDAARIDSDEGRSFEGENDLVVEKDVEYNDVERYSSVSNSSSVICFNQPTPSDRSLLKASCVSLEVPENWWSQSSEILRRSFNPVCSSADETAHLRVASTPTVGVKIQPTPPLHEVVRDLSTISCSPITPSSVLHAAFRSRSRERLEPLEFHDQDDDVDGVTVIPCSPATPQSAKDQCQLTNRRRSGTDSEDDNNEDIDDVTVIPCTPVTPASSNGADGKLKAQEMALVPSVSLAYQAIGHQLLADERQIFRLKVIFCLFCTVMICD